MSKWKAPAGWKLTRHEGYTINNRGQRISPETRPNRRALMPDGAISVVHFNDAEPFYADKHAVSGEEGWSPNAELKPIKDGVIPPVYTLEKKGE